MLDDIKEEISEDENILDQYEFWDVVSTKNEADVKSHHYKCIVCDFLTNNKTRMKEHNLTKHTSEEERQKFMKNCPMCDYSSLRASCVKLHFERVHEKKIHKCDWEGCDFEAERIQMLNEHTLSVHEGVEYICSDCGFETSNSNNLQKHRKTCHMNEKDNKSQAEGVVNTFLCGDCDFKTSDNSILVKHIYYEHGNGSKGSSPLLMPKDDVKQEENDFDYTGVHDGLVNAVLDENEAGGAEFKNLLKNINAGQQHSTSKRKEYKCTSCEFKATRPMALKEHKLSKHTSEEERQKYLKKCPECDYTSVRVSCIKRHFEIMHERKTYTCEWFGCDFVTQRKQLLKDHIRSVHQGMQFICDKCGFETTTQDYLSKHIKTVHGTENDSLLCEQCSFIAQAGPELKKHMDNHNLFAFTCNECDYRTKNEKLLNRHISLKHGNKEPFLCDECHFTTRLKGSLTRHIANVHNGLRFPCPDCEFEAKSRTYLYEHVRRRHNKAVDASYFIAHPHLMPMNTNGIVKALKIPEYQKSGNRCEICQKMFKDESKLIEHKRVHTGERPFSCQLCNKSYPIVKSLKVHMRLIHGDGYQDRENPNRCKVCSIKFDRLSRLIEHELTHTGEQPYQCVICGDKFSYTESFSRHMKLHTQENNMFVPSLNSKEPEQELSYDEQLWRNTVNGSAVGYIDTGLSMARSEPQ